MGRYTWMSTSRIARLGKMWKKLKIHKSMEDVEMGGGQRSRYRCHLLSSAYSATPRKTHGKDAFYRINELIDAQMIAHVLYRKGIRY